MKRTSLTALPSIKQLLLLTVGIVLSSFGVALSAKCRLGISPISCPPYVLSRITPWSMGNITIAMNALFILLQILLLRKDYRPKDLLQLVLAILYGRVMDMSLGLLRNFEPVNYFLRLGLCLASVAVVALGVFLVVRADVLMLAGEGLESAIAKVTGKPFGLVKVAVDCSLAAIGFVLSVLFLHRVEGLREGTIIAAVGTGLLVQLYQKLCHSARERKSQAEPSVREKKPHLVVTITREFDPAAVEIAERLSRQMGLPLYDDELVAMTAQEGNIPISFVREREDRVTKGLLDRLVEDSFQTPYLPEESKQQDALLRAQERVIRRLADEQDCIILGRNANRILGNRPPYFHVFLYGEAAKRVEHSMRRFHISREEAAALVSRADAQRRRNTLSYPGSAWNTADDYTLCLDTTRFGVEKTAALLQRAIVDSVYETEQAE